MSTCVYPNFSSWNQRRTSWFLLRPSETRKTFAADGSERCALRHVVLAVHVTLENEKSRSESSKCPRQLVSCGDFCYSDLGNLAESAGPQTPLAAGNLASATRLAP